MPDLAAERDWLSGVFDRQTRSLGDSAWIADRCCADLLEMPLRFRGFENFYMDLALDPETSIRMFDMVADYVHSRLSTRLPEMIG